MLIVEAGVYTSVLISINASHPETAVQALENFPGRGGGARLYCDGVDLPPFADKTRAL